MEQKVQEVFREALSEENEFKRLRYLSKGCKQLSEMLPFPTMGSILSKQKELIQFLFIASPLFGAAIEMILQALIEKLQYQVEFIQEFYNSALTVAQIQELNGDEVNQQQRYCSDVYRNLHQIKKGVLIQCKNYANIQIVNLVNQLHRLKHNSQKNPKICHSIIHFYKGFIEFNSKYDLLTLCFQDAMYLRKHWPDLTFCDPYFDREVEELLIKKSFQNNQNNVKQVDDLENLQEEEEKKNLLDLLQQKKKDERKNQETNESENSMALLSKQERMIKMLEDWLFYEREYPLVSMQSSTANLHCDLFRNANNFEAVFSFLFNPIKYRQVSDFRLKSIPQETVNFLDIPDFRMNQNSRLTELYQMDQDERCLLQYRAFRSMQALTNSKNHFLITSVNSEYFQRAFSLIYESLKVSMSGLMLASSSIIQYLQFILYYEPDITIYFLIYYNIPFRLLLFIDIPQVSQFLFQLSTYGTPILKIQMEQHNLLWKYFEYTEFFMDLIKVSLNKKESQIFDLIMHQKVNASYKPKFLTKELSQPDFTPLQNQKIPYKLEQKRLAEEMQLGVKDIDLIQEILMIKQQRAFKIFEKLIANSPKRRRKATMPQAQPSPIKVKQVKQNQKEEVSSKFKKIDNKPNESSIFKRRNFQKLETTNFGQPNLQQARELIKKKSIEILNPIPDKEEEKQRISKLEQALLYSEKDMKKSSKKLNDLQQSNFQASTKSIKLIKTHRQIFSLHVNPFTPSPSNEQNRCATSQVYSLKDQLVTSPSSQTSLIQRYKRIIQIKRPNTTISGRASSVGFDDPDYYKEKYLYPSSMRDFVLTNLEQESNKEDYDEERLQRNELFSKQTIQLLYDIICLYANDDNKMRIIVGNNLNIFIDKIALNYFLKLKVPQDQEEYSSAIISGFIYNKVLKYTKKDMYLKIEQQIFDHFQFLCSILSSTFLMDNNKAQPFSIQGIEIGQILNAKTLVLIQTLGLILERGVDKQKYLHSMSTSLWHLLFIYLVQYKNNDIYMQNFERIVCKALLYGNLQTFNKLLLKLNCLNQMKSILEQIYSNNILDADLKIDSLFRVLRNFVIILYCIIKIRENEFQSLKQQINIMASWSWLKSCFKMQELKNLEKGTFVFEQYFSDPEDKTYFYKIQQQYATTKQKRRLY